MDIYKLLKVIQVQRHDFVNHIQVISGLLQLGRPDRARDFIGRILEDMERYSNANRLTMPEITAVLLSGFIDAATHEVEVEVLYNSSLKLSAVPGAVAGEAIERCIDLALGVLALQHVKPKRLTVVFSENKNGCSCSLRLNITDGSMPDPLEEEMASVRHLLAKYDGQVILELTGNELNMVLKFPFKRDVQK